MAKQFCKMTFEPTEMVLNYDSGKGRKDLMLSYDQIISISIDKCTVRKFFKTIETERVGVTPRQFGVSINYYAYKEGPYFQGYKDGLRKFAKENRISIYDSLKEQDGVK